MSNRRRAAGPVVALGQTVPRLRTRTAVRVAIRLLGVALVVLFLCNCGSRIDSGIIAPPPPPPPLADTGPPLDTVHLAPASTLQVASGGTQSCALRVDGSIVCWGVWGGIGPTLPMRIPTAIDSYGALVAFASISAGSQLCGLSVSGEAYCETGARASSGSDSSAAPRALVPVTTRHRFRVLVSGYQTSCALTPSGQGFCWGDGSVGSLGTGQFGAGYAVTSPTPIATSLRFTALASGGGAVNCGIATDNAGYCWGGEKGSVFITPSQAGSCADIFWQRYATPCAVPTLVSGAPPFRFLSAQMQTACGIALDGHAVCWGIGPNGELGNGQGGDGTFSIPAVNVAGNLTFSAISLGATFGCALTATGSAYCWGNNFSGFLGSPGGFSAVPRPVAGGLTFQALAAGALHTCAVSLANEIWCWGDGGYGQLGRDPALGGTSVPIRVSMPTP
jgi:alpha-tubulin suppressor-like RCC1 family protein